MVSLRLGACSRRCWWPTGARSPSGRSARRTSSAPRRSRSSRTRTAAPSTGSRPTRPTRSASAATRCGPISTRKPIVDAAVRAGADAVYPGYGFLSENPALAEACAAAGITFVGPSSDVLRLTGNKASAVAAAQRGRRPGAAQHRTRRATSTRSAATRPQLDFPVFVKAVAGGGGRGMRRVDDPDDLRDGRRGGDARGRRRVRRPDGVRRGGRHRPAPHRGADPRRQPGQRHPPVRARLLAAAPPPEGRRDRPGSQPRPRPARPDLRRRGRLRQARSATSTPAPSSSWSTPTAGTSSSR